MPLPQPMPGLVIRYSYLWHREQSDGHEEGRKDRPCAIVAALRIDKAGDTRVLVLPITHNAPDPVSEAVEIPPKVKARLRLDEARSWVVLSEWNEFVWPGPDLRRLPNADNASVAYGMLPPALFERTRERFMILMQKGGSRPVRRT